MRARDNPFATERVLTIRYRLLDESWDDLIARLHRLNHRCAIVGPEGSGKTTLLEDLQHWLEQQGQRTNMLRLSRERPAIPRARLNRFVNSLKSDEFILIDGTEQLPRMAWRRIKHGTQRCRGLIITSHRNGLLPSLLHTRTTPQLLHTIVNQLLGHRPAAIDSLFAKHRGNLRDSLRELYDFYASDKLHASSGQDNQKHLDGVRRFVHV